jgi:signal transduction histidine kinase
MKLRLKFALAIVFATSAASLILGISALSMSFQASVNQVEQNISEFKNLLTNSDQDKVSMAILAGDTSPFNITFVEADGTISPVVDNFNEMRQEFLLTRELGLDSGEKLFISADIKNIVTARNAATNLTLAFSISAGLLSGLLALLLLRKDLKAISRLTSEAKQISSGELEEISELDASGELVTLSRALQTMTKQLQSSRAQLKVFIGDASHELKTPLTVIRGYLDLLSRHEDMAPAKRKLAIERSLSESLRMQQLISDLLQLAELEEVPAIDMESFNLGELVKEQVYDLQALQPGRKVELVLEQDGNFVGSKPLITQLLANAFQNISRHTNETDDVRVTLQPFEGKLYLLIEDSGPGIATLKKGRVINSFNRFDEARSRSAGGSGLGLSIMAKIVDLHGGKMELSRSELGGLLVAISFQEKHDA